MTSLAALFLALATLPGVVTTPSPPVESAPALLDPPTTQPPLDPAESWDGLKSIVEELALEQLPTRYVNEKNWGRTREVFDGVRLRREGLRLETERKWKTVNDGTWTRYELSLPSSKAGVDLRIDQGKALSENRWQTELTCEAPLHVFGRLAIWERGVQLLSVNADADAKVRLRVRAELTTGLDISRIPPELLLDPQVTAAEVELLDFRLHRVSQLHGPLAKHLGEGLEDLIQDRVREANASLVEKLNRQIDKKRDRLRLSLTSTLAKKWANWTRVDDPAK
ncbi:MAG: hypothetical protein FJ295_19835 [Planctomycetes bacterium]|nr:hypothetical protein [Planctomycetota bacterium]